MTTVRDCVVIGGGPAGSTFASIAKQACPSQAITILEQARFPRYHVGESTIPVANGVLRELGVFDRLLRGRSVKKMGIVFVWGRDRVPWTADFIRLRDVDVDAGDQHIVDVTGLSFRSLLEQLRGADSPFLGFNVRRAEFDAILLDRSRELGVEIREGTRATGILHDERGAVRGVRWRDDQGNEGVIETAFVLDAGGLSSLLTRGRRDRDPHMNNFAIYGYLSSAEWKVTYNGTRDRSTIFIATVDKGWIWYFPIEDDVMSVGVVTHRDHFSDRLAHVDLEQLWWEMLRSCPEVAGLVEHATLRDDILPAGKRVAASQDWSSWARAPVGDGWATAGDAAAFVDPVLSSGVTMALQSGYRAAYTYNTVRLRPDLPAASLWQAYADYVRGEVGSFLRLARYFYGNNRAAESWWWESQRVVNRSGQLDLDERQSFTMATAGFFPTPRSISPAVVGGLLANLSGTRNDLYRVFRESGVPAADEIERGTMEVVVPFRLGLRAEPTLATPHDGMLDVYHDLVSDEPSITHRYSAVSSRISPVLAPVVAALHQHHRVASLLDAAPTLVASTDLDAVELRRQSLDMVRVAALKGFVRLGPP